jgi:hypothetical protein
VLRDKGCENRRHLPLMAQQLAISKFSEVEG